MAIQATGRATFTAVEDYDIVFVLNGVRCDTLNFDSVRAAESAVLEADFFNGGAECVVDRAVLGCYDGEGALMGSTIEARDSSSAVADGGSLYLSKNCKTVSCEIYAGGKKVCSRSLAVVRNGSGVGVKAVSYKVLNNVAAGGALNWDSVQSQANYPTQKPDKGLYMYVMTIVLYTDGTTTNTVSTSYTPTDGKSVTITSKNITYAGGDSGVTPPTGGWQTSVPSLELGKYLWTKTRVEYSDGNSTESYSVGRIGKDGDKGATTHILYASSGSPKSKDDVRATMDETHQWYGTYQDTNLADDTSKYTEVKSWTLIKGEKGEDGTQYRVVEQYAYGTSNTAAPTSGWSDSISGGAAGQYLWNQETTQHKAATDTAWVQDSVTTHCVGYIAKNGENGANFTGVQEYYMATADEKNAPAIDSSWQATPTAAGWSAGKPYLWNYEIITRDKGGNITTQAHLDSVWGKKGDSAVAAKLRVDHSVCHFSRTSNSWDYDSVTVSIVIMDGDKTEIPAYGDMTKYFWRLSTDDTSTKRSSGMEFSASLTKSSITANLYKTGSDENVAIDTITVPMVFDGQNGEGQPATVYTIEPFGDIEASGTLKDGNTITVTVRGNVRAFKTTGDSKAEYSTQPQCWKMSVGDTDYCIQNNNSPFSNNAANSLISFSLSQDYGIDSVPGSANITLYKDNTLEEQLASLIVPISLNAGAIQDINNKLGTIQSTTLSLQGEITSIQQGQGQISLKVQDLQNGGVDTSKPHTSSQVDFRTLDADSFYPVMIRFKDYGDVRHTVEISRNLDGTYGSGKDYMRHSQGFSFRLIFSDIANGWGINEDGQLHIESISQRWTEPTDTPICPKIAQYYPFSFTLAWLRGGSKYDITVDCTDAHISGIWPYMMQVASNPSWVPDAVRLAPDTWTTAQVNAQGGNPYNMLRKDNGGYYADVDNEYLYRFGELAAGNTFAIVGQPKDSKVWFMATWHITSVSGSKVYVDVSTYGLLWQAQNPLGIRMGELGYIKTGASYPKSTWDSQNGFGTSENVDNTAVHADWAVPRAILVIGKESSATNGVYRDRAILECVNSFTKNSDGESGTVSFSSGTYFDVSPLYGTDGRTNVKPDLLATGIDIKSHKITATTDNFEIRNNSGTLTFSIDEDGNIVGVGNASFKGSVTAKTFTLSSDKFYVDNNGKFKLKMTNFSVKEDGTITAKGGSVSFFNFDSAGMYSGSIEQDGKIYSGLGMSMNNLSVSGNNNRRISSVFLGNGTIDSRFTNSDNRTVYRVGSTIEGSTFYNYIKLERIGSGSFSFENSPEHAALGIETQGDFCLAALGGPSYFEGLCFPSARGSSSMTADGNRTMYLFSGGDFYMPSNPPDGLEIKVIQTGSKITFHDGGHKFRNGLSYRDTFTSDTRGQWNFFYFDGSNWHWNYMNK